MTSSRILTKKQGIPTSSESSRNQENGNSSKHVALANNGYSNVTGADAMAISLPIAMQRRTLTVVPHGPSRHHLTVVPRGPSRHRARRTASKTTWSTSTAGQRSSTQPLRPNRLHTNWDCATSVKSRPKKILGKGGMTRGLLQWRRSALQVQFQPSLRPFGSVRFQRSIPHRLGALQSVALFAVQMACTIAMSKSLHITNSKVQVLPSRLSWR